MPESRRQPAVYSGFKEALSTGFDPLEGAFCARGRLFKKIATGYKKTRTTDGMIATVKKENRRQSIRHNKLNWEDFIMSILNDISSWLQQGRAPKVKACVQQAIDEGIPAQEILEQGLLDGMNIIGQKFKNNEVFVPEVLIAARAMTKGIEVLRPHLVADGVEEKGTVVLGTVKGDLHDIGKNLVRMMMEGKGLKVIDLGVDVPVEKFLDAARENNAKVICCSALLTTTMGEMRSVVEAVEASELKGQVQIMIGGAPVTQTFCDQISADRYTADAATAADVALEICTGKAS